MNHSVPNTTRALWRFLLTDHGPQLHQAAAALARNAVLVFCLGATLRMLLQQLIGRGQRLLARMESSANAPTSDEWVESKYNFEGESSNDRLTICINDHNPETAPSPRQPRGFKS